MSGLSEMQYQSGVVASPNFSPNFVNPTVIGGPSKYRRTIFFALTALLVIAIATTIAATKVNGVIVSFAEKQLVNLAHEATTRDARHIQSMVTDRDFMGVTDNRHGSLTTEETTSSGNNPLTLEVLMGPAGLPAQFENLADGLGVIESSFIAPTRAVMWSTNPEAVGKMMPATDELELALSGSISSKLVASQRFIGGDGSVFTMDAVKTYFPMRASPTSPIIGILEVNRSVGSDLELLIHETKETVVWTSFATMAVLFLALVGFVIVSDQMIFRSNQRRLALAESQLAEREQAQLVLAEHARELEVANQELESLTKRLIETQDELVRTERLAAVGQLSAGVAHDLRNPLGAIMNAAYYIKNQLRRATPDTINPKVFLFLDVIDEQIARSDQVIKDLMSLTRVRALELNSARIDILVEEALSTFVKLDEIQLQTRIGPELGKVMADRDQLQRVFLNLANNAQEAMPNSGDLTVSGARRHGKVEISFTDSGVGISPENIEKVFDPLFTTKAKGTGLGLAICNDIVNKHGGTLSVTNNAGVSGGVTFTVALPAVTA